VGLQIDNQNCHVVSADTLCGSGVVAQNLMQHLFANIFGFLRVNTLPNKLNCLLIGETVPNTVTSKDEKLVLRIQCDPIPLRNEMRCFTRFMQTPTIPTDYLLQDIRLGSNHLICRSYSGYLFVFQIANRSRQIQIAIYPAKSIHETTSIVDAVHFSRLLGFVVKAQWLCNATFATQNSSRITRIRDGQSPTQENSNDCSTSGVDWMFRKITYLFGESVMHDEGIQVSRGSACFKTKLTKRPFCRIEGAEGPAFIGVCI
jgi:hypothetical protein